MDQNTTERWQELCAQASVEKDSKKFLTLIEEINRLLAEKDKRLQQRAGR